MYISDTMADSPVLIVCDSRGRTLEPILKEVFVHLDVVVIWESGLTLMNTFKAAEYSILKHHPKLIYILTGICDITMLLAHNPRQVVLRNLTIAETVYSYIQKVDFVHSQIFSMKASLGYGPMVIFPTQTGVDMARYSSFPGNLYHPQQRTLNEAIATINRTITTQNASMNVLTPFLACPVHTRCRGRVRTMYSKLSDGCHLTTELSRLWASKIYENSLLNADRFDHYNLTNHLYAWH